MVQWGLSLLDVQKPHARAEQDLIEGGAMEPPDIASLTPGLLRELLGPDVLTAAELLPSVSRLFLERTLVSIYLRNETDEKSGSADGRWGPTTQWSPSKSILGRGSTRQSPRQAVKVLGWD